MNGTKLCGKIKIEAMLGYSKLLQHLNDQKFLELASAYQVFAVELFTLSGKVINYEGF